MTQKKKILLVYSTQSGRTLQLAQAAMEGAAEFADEVEIRLMKALDAGVEDLMACDGLLLGTPENFGYMSGALKDFLDRTYYPCEGQRIGLPYAVFISAGNDGTGAVNAIERIAIGFGWNAISPALIVVGDPQPVDLERSRELGQIMAAGLSCGIF